MYFSFASFASTVLLVLPLTALAAPATPVSGLENRSRKTHKVTVGAWGKLRYDPEYVHAKVGDYIKFEFHPKNHTVTENWLPHWVVSVMKPTIHALYSHVLLSVPVPEKQTSHFPTRKFKVTDYKAQRGLFQTKPHWFYCGQVGHCPAGMVFAVNPPKKGNTFDKFQKMAMESDD
ncbi:hypothetical protein FRC07_006298 [Ceratobasidium sp. 392]|nr:hypothetical protein FRC07_006298 [Ceratobasidium sp. 392]